MEHIGARKTRTIIDAAVKATAAAEGLPAFPTGPDANGRVVFAGDLSGARISGFRWTGTFTGFTAADLTVQHSDDGENWYDLKAFTQDSSGPAIDQYLPLLDTDPAPMAYIRGKVTMTGTPGTSTHTLKAEYEQVGPRGHLAPPGYVDRAS